MKGRDIQKGDEFSVEATIIALRKQDKPYRNIKVLQGTLVCVLETKLVIIGKRKRFLAKINIVKSGIQEIQIDVLASDLVKLLATHQVKKLAPKPIAAT